MWFLQSWLGQVNLSDLKGKFSGEIPHATLGQSTIRTSENVSDLNNLQGKMC